MSNDSWQKWYDSLSKRGQWHYHYNRKLFFSSGLVSRADEALGYSAWTDIPIKWAKKFGCLLFGHDMTDGNYKYTWCAYCEKLKD